MPHGFTATIRIEQITVKAERRNPPEAEARNQIIKSNVNHRGWYLSGLGAESKMNECQTVGLAPLFNLFQGAVHAQQMD